MTDASAIPELLRRFHAQDRVALNRLISLVARGEAIDQISSSLAGGGVSTRLVAFTGNSGVGKSSLIGRLIEVIRSNGETVAVLACDPESVLTGGALLGDRVRMSDHAADDGVWIRSLASASGRQAIADHLDLAAKLLSQFGFEHILLETVGAGQGDVAVESIADLVVLLVQPEIGDELQWEKAGVLEVADIVVVQKGDLPGAEQTEAQVRALLNLPDSPETPVLRVSAKTKEGINSLWTLVQAAARHERRDNRSPRLLVRLVQERVAELITAQPTAVQSIVADWSRGDLSEEMVVQRTIEKVICCGRGD